jgi:hypothetical protein
LSKKLILYEQLTRELCKSHAGGGCDDNRRPIIDSAEIDAHALVHIIGSTMASITKSLARLNKS